MPAARAPRALDRGRPAARDPAPGGLSAWCARALDAAADLLRDAASVACFKLFYSGRPMYQYQSTYFRKCCI